MGNVHVLSLEGNAYSLVLHVVTPVGNNSAGVGWAAVYVGAFKPASVLAAGDGTKGTISATEAAAVVAGTTLEIPTQFVPNGDFETKSGAQQQAEIDAWYAYVTSGRLAKLALELKWWGLVLT